MINEFIRVYSHNDSISFYSCMRLSWNFKPKK